MEAGLGGMEACILPTDGNRCKKGSPTQHPLPTADQEPAGLREVIWGDDLNADSWAPLHPLN